MSYQWPLNAEELFGERYPQMVNTGLPAAEVDAVRAAITDMWADAPGGWVHEWSKLAAAYAEAGAPRLAALAYGWAKFPVLADAPKTAALTRQLEQYRLAVPSFGVDFRRETLDSPGGAIPVHLFAPDGVSPAAPVILASGGVDSWKMDLHDLMVGLAVRLGVRVLAFDLPGTGETPGPMTPDGGVEAVRGLLAHARTLGNGAVAHVGVSMGGYYSARAGLAGEADAAVVLGGPVEAAFEPGQLGHFGMHDIVGNALGFAASPAPAELSARLAEFSLRPLLDEDRNAPMLIVNGADDVHVPQHDTLVFEGRRDTEVHLLPDTGHCAVSRFPDAIGIIADWLAKWVSGVRG
jgi:esterase FrsA